MARALVASSYSAPGCLHVSSFLVATASARLHAQARIKDIPQRIAGQVEGEHR